MNRLLVGVAILSGTCLQAQHVISAHSGLIQYVEGQVAVDGKQVQPKFGEFPSIQTGQTLATEDGRAEVLLTPGVFLRLAENTSVGMVSNLLADTKLELTAGSILVEVGQLLPNNAISLRFRDTQISLLKQGLYRVDADPGTLRVFGGEATVRTSEAKVLEIKKGRELDLDEQAQSRSFDRQSTDAFYRWAERRSEYIADANLVAAKTASDNQYSGGSYSSGYLGLGSGLGSWAWNPYFGMFTYIPAAGMWWSPFGSAYFSPGLVGYAYYPQSGFSPAGHLSGVSATSGIHAAPHPIAPSSLAGNSGGMGGTFGGSGLSGAPIGGGSGGGFSSRGGSGGGGGMHGGSMGGARGR